MSEKFTSIHYHSYLQLDKLLDAQHPRSAQVEESVAHDEMLFIIMHQVYELWFKQIIHELESISLMFEDNLMDEKEILKAVTRLERIIEIQKLLIEQINVMETLTAMDFLDFRQYLFPASGFQSLQFRIIENLLGLKQEQRLQYNNMSYDVVFSDEQKKVLNRSIENKSLLTHVIEWLDRTPFLEFSKFSFLEAYKIAVERMVQKDKDAINASDILSEETKKLRLTMVGDTTTYFNAVFDPDQFEEMRSRGEVKFSYKAMLAALFIFLYRDEPILQQPYRLLSRLMDIEEMLTNWRSRHSQMVLRMIGRKTGTGGSSGHQYLKNTAQQHTIFTDLYQVATLLIPRSELPPLPEDLRQYLGFYFSSHENVRQ
ncbi:MAG TPA: tryptophan 2,3-dioxygenase family protein [Saprospiraceae bacterium]|nr:tryptophan 2,3-dioxygenase family protein [Saprospiraceae bacterium]